MHVVIPLRFELDLPRPSVSKHAAKGHGFDYMKLYVGLSVDSL